MLLLIPSSCHHDVDRNNETKNCPFTAHLTHMSALSNGNSVKSSNVTKRSHSLTRVLWTVVTSHNTESEREPERLLLAAALDIKPDIVPLSRRKPTGCSIAGLRMAWEHQLQHRLELRPASLS